MRCNEARKRIADLNKKISSGSIDDEIKRHIQSCPDCALFFQAERTINRDLETIVAADDNDGMSVAEMRNRVESIAAMDRSKKPEEFKFMSAIKKQLWARPRLSISLGTVIILLIFSTLIPIKMDRTIGYEVAVAGVDKNLAMDERKITELFIALGMEHVEYKVDGCEATCEMTISDLKTDMEKQLIIMALYELGNCVVKEVKEISEDESTSIFNQFKHKYTKLRLNFDEQSINDIVIERLDSLHESHDGKFNIFIGEGSDSDNMVDISEVVWTGTTAEGEPYELDQNDPEFWEKLKATGDPYIEFHTQEEHNQGIDSYQSVTNNASFAPKHGTELKLANGTHFEFVDQTDGEMICMVTSPQLGKFNIILNDEGAAEQLRQLGLPMDDNGVIQINEQKLPSDMLLTITELSFSSESNPVSIYEDSHVNKPEAMLPDGFELEQNYPNPFNPTTTIKFSLPEAEDVLLEVYNINGQRVKTLIDEYKSAGQHSVIWDATNSNGEKVASGIYLYRLTAGEVTTSKKMSLLK